MKKKLSIVLIVVFLLVVASFGLTLPIYSSNVQPVEEERRGARTPVAGWVVKAPLPELLEGAAGAVVEGKIYVLKGHNSSVGDTGDVRIYDPTMDSWSYGTSSPIVDAEFYQAGVVSGKIYVIGGRNTFNGSEEYDPLTDTWTNKTLMPTGRAGHALGVVNNTIYVIGGRNGSAPLDGNVTNVVEAYDPSTDTWTTGLAPMPTARSDMAAAVVNGKIYVIGGWNETIILSTVEVYDPFTDTWSSRAAMPTPRADLGAVDCSGHIHAIGGINATQNGNATQVGTHEIYDPANDTWSIAEPMPTPRAELVVVNVGGPIYAIGGGIYGESVDANEAYACMHVFPSGTFVIPMDEKQNALTPENVTVFGFIWATLDGGASIYRIIQPPNVTLKTTTYPEGAVFTGGVILVMPAYEDIIADKLLSFQNVTVDTLTENFAIPIEQVFYVEKPTKILVIYGVWAHTEMTLDWMAIPYTLVNTTDVETNATIIFDYDLVVVDCPGWPGYMPSHVASNFTAFASQGGEVIFTDIALLNLAQVFPGYVNVVGNLDWTGNVSIHNPPLTGFPAEFPSQYPATFPQTVKIYTMGGGNIVDSLLKPSDVRVLMDASDYGGNYRVLAFYFPYDRGLVECFAYHPQEQIEIVTGDNYSYVVSSLLYGNKFIHGIAAVEYERDVAVSLETPAFLEPGGYTLLNATVYNIGLSNETNVKLQLLINGTIVDSVVIPELSTGSSYTLSYFWTPTVKGIYNVTAYASPLLGEAVTTNNVVSKIVQVYKRDVAVVNVTPSKTVVGKGYCMNITVTVENQGDFTETFRVFAYYTDVTMPTPGQWETFWSMGDVNIDGYIDSDDLYLIQIHFGSSDPQYDLNNDGSVNIIDSGICLTNQGKDIWTHFGLGPPPIGMRAQRVVELYPGNQTTLTFTWNTTGIAKGNYTINATATQVPDETDLDDNTITDGWVVVTRIGDVNGDGSTNVLDIVMCCINMGPAPPNPPECDVNGDGEVNVQDIILCCINMG